MNRATLCGLLALMTSSIASPVATAGDVLPPLDPAGFMLTSPGSPDGFGRLVDVSGTRVLIASDTQAFVYDVAEGAWEPGPTGLDLLAGYGATDVRSIALNGTLARIAFGDASGVDNDHTFAFDGSTWTPLELGTTPAPLGVAVASAPDATRITASSQPWLFGLPQTTLSVGMAGSATPPAEITWTQERIVSLAVAPGPTVGAPLSIVIVTEIGVTRALRLVTGDASGLTDHGIFYFGDTADGYGDALDATQGHVVLGAPRDAGGTVRRFLDLGGALQSTNGSTSISPADAHYGQAVAVDDGLCVEARNKTNPLWGGEEIGEVWLRRPNTVGYFSGFVQEMHFDPDADPALPRGFGQALSLDRPLLAIGSPGNGLADGRVLVRPVPPDYVFALESDSGLGYPIPYGSTVPGAPFQLYAPASVASSIAPEGNPWLVLGLAELAAPFKGGVMLPSPDVVLPLPQNPDGSYTLLTTWPDVPGIDFTLYHQVWAQDASAPFGWVSTAGWSSRQFATL